MSQPAPPSPPSRPLARASTAARIAALCEVIFVLVAGAVLSTFALRAVGWTGSPSLLSARLSEMSDAELTRIAGTMAVELLARYGLTAALFLAISAWYRRRPLAAYGVTRNRRSWRALALTGVAVYCLADLPMKVLLGVHHHLLPLGDGPPHWREIFSMTWGPGFWALTAVASFGLVPLVEELFYRGYVQTRWTEDFGAAGAVVIGALFFALGHGQYHRADVLSIGTVISLLWAALLLGWIVHRSGSLVPAIVAHALINVPVRGWAIAAVLAAMVSVVIGCRRQIAAHAADLRAAFGAIEERRSVALAALTAVAFMVSISLGGASTIFLGWGLVAGVVALPLLVRERRRRKALY